MMTKKAIEDLFAHMEWADSRVWTAVLASEAACTDEKLRETLYHLHHVQYAFLRVWRGEPREAPYPTFDSTPPMASYARSFYPNLGAYLDTVSDEALEAPMIIPWASMVEKRIGRPASPTTSADTALQVAMHSQYHRGQVNARLRSIGGEPPLVDYIVWVWLGRPRPEWPEV